MSHIALKNILATAALASPEQFENWQKAWRVAITNGSQESLLEFVSRESGISEEAFLQQLGGVLRYESEPGKTSFEMLLPAHVE